MNSDIKLYFGDCLSIMSQIDDKSIDCIICDLPYGQTSMEWDKLLDFNQLWWHYNRICKDNANIILFSSGEFTYKLYESNKKQYKYKLIWKKNVPTGMSTAKYRPMKYYEEILVFHKGKPTYNAQLKERIGKHKECYNYQHYFGGSNHIQLEKIPKKYDPDKVQPSDILEFNVVPNRSGKLHPTQKPIDLLEYLIKTYTNNNDVVLDNCMGSGSTGVACKNTGRKFIGIELNKDYFNIAEKRITDNKINPTRNKLF